jgi:hypothetical protein
MVLLTILENEHLDASFAEQIQDVLRAHESCLPNSIRMLAVILWPEIADPLERASWVEAHAGGSRVGELEKQV